MNLFALSGLLIGVTSISMAVLMLVIGKERLHHIWALFCVSVAIWGFGGYMIAITKDIEQAYMWWRLTHIGVIFIPVLFMHFVYEFLQKNTRPMIPILYALGIFFLWANLFSNLFIANLRWVFDQFYYDSPPGILYVPFTAFFLGFVIFSHLLLWRALKHTAGLKKLQIQYFLVAMGVSFAGGSLSFLPVYEIDFYPFFNILAFMYTPIITYAILRKQLFDIRVVLTQFLVGVIAILLFINFVLSKTGFEYLWKGGVLLAFLGVGYLLVKSVLNEIKQKEQLQEAYKKLEELDRSKSEFVSIASHQLRTPLTAMKGYISMILEGSYGKLETKQKKPLESISESNERLIRLVNDLLNVSRIESGKVEMKWEQGSVEEIIKSVVEELGIKIKEKNAELVFEEPESSLPLVRIDKEKIRNVVLNVIDNAIRYTPKGNIVVNAKCQMSNVKTSNLLISVQDTGEGMTQEEMGKLFQTFSRGGAGMRFSTEGAGLGLYIAKKFVEMHKGRIWVESEGKGKGSTFFVELPVQ